MQLRIHQCRDGGHHVIGREGRAVGELNALPKLERDAASVLGDLPRGRQFGLVLLGFAIDPNQYPAGEIAHNFRGIVFHQQRVRGFWIRLDSEMQFSAALRPKRECQKKNKWTVNYCSRAHYVFLEKREMSTVDAGFIVWVGFCVQREDGAKRSSLRMILSAA